MRLSGTQACANFCGGNRKNEHIPIDWYRHNRAISGVDDILRWAPPIGMRSRLPSSPKNWRDMNNERIPFEISKSPVINPGTIPRVAAVFKVPALPSPCARISTFPIIFPRMKAGETLPTAYETAIDSRIFKTKPGRREPPQPAIPDPYGYRLRVSSWSDRCALSGISQRDDRSGLPHPPGRRCTLRPTHRQRSSC